MIRHFRAWAIGTNQKLAAKCPIIHVYIAVFLHPSLIRCIIEKGCACRDAATLTFIGRDGGYDLVREGTADGSPTLTGITSRDLAAAAIQTLTDRAS